MSISRGDNMSVDQAQVVEYIKNLKLSEVKALIEVLETELGVSASAPVMAFAGGAGGAAAAEEVEEKTEFDVELLGDFDAKAKVKIIKAVREITGAGLKDAKGMVEGAPSVLKEGVSKDQAEEYKTKLEAVGAKVAIK
jgi:large subunit ribosomal protein L7/L12